MVYAFILGFIGFVTSFGAHIVAVNLPVYAKQIGVGMAFIGLLIAAYDLAEIVAKPISGALADKYGMKKTMLMGIIFFIPASLSYLWIPPSWLLLVRFLQGMGAAALSAVSLALIGLYYETGRGRAYGIYNAVKGAGYVVSPVLGGVIVLNSGFSSIFVASAAIGTVAFIIALFLPPPISTVTLDDDDLSLSSAVSILKDPKLWTWYVVIVVNMFFMSILFGFLPVRVYALGYDPEMTGILLSVVALSYLLIQPVAGWMSDKLDTARTVRVGLVLSVLSIMLIPFVNGFLFLVVSVIAGMGVGVVWTNTDHLISRLAREGQLGITMGAAGSFKEFGDMLGPILIGLISQMLGLAAGFVICGVLGLLCIALIPRATPKNGQS